MRDPNPIERLCAALPEPVAYALGYGILAASGAVVVAYLVGL